MSCDLIYKSSLSTVLSQRDGYKAWYRSWRWLSTAKEKETFEDLKQAMVIEQLVDLSPEEVQLWPNECEPADEVVLLELADHYIMMHAQHAKGMASKKPNSSNPSSGLQQLSDEDRAEHMRQGGCYKCGEKGHLAADCIAIKKGAGDSEKGFQDKPKATSGPAGYTA